MFASIWKRTAVSFQLSGKNESEINRLSADGYPLKTPSGNPSFRMAIKEFVLLIKSIRGFRDILPGEVEKWQFLEGEARGIFELFGFAELRVPVLERTELFARSIGEETDIVGKEMYTFPDRDGDSLTLRPEATASIMRAYLENGLQTKEPVGKYYFIGPMFRHERPQKGRYRQFHQIDAEILGVLEPWADAEMRHAAKKVQKNAARNPIFVI